VQLAARLHLKCNVEPRRTINFIKLIQVEGDKRLQTTLPAGSMPWQSFNDSLSSSTYCGCAGKDIGMANCWPNFYWIAEPF